MTPRRRNSRCMMGGMRTPAVIPASSRRVSIFFPSYPRFQAGIHLYKPQIAKVVGNTDEERSFFSRNGHNMEVIGHKAISLYFDMVPIALVF